MNVVFGTIMARLFRAREKLRTRMKAADSQDSQKEATS